VTCHLQGQVILNTRPVHQQAELTRMLQRDGAELLCFPVIDIEPIAIGPEQTQLAQSIGDYDILLFVSRNAVEGAFRFIDSACLPSATCFGVIGSATRSALAAALADSHFNLDDCLLAGEPYSSETLLVRWWNTRKSIDVPSPHRAVMSSIVWLRRRFRRWSY